jgi:hypothetical protein
VKKTGAKILSSATTVDEGRWLVEHGCDAIIAQGSRQEDIVACFSPKTSPPSSPRSRSCPCSSMPFPSR